MATGFLIYPWMPGFRAPVSHNRRGRIEGRRVALEPLISGLFHLGSRWFTLF